MPDDLKIALKTVYDQFGLISIMATDSSLLFLRNPVILIVPTGSQSVRRRKVSEVEDAIGR